MLLVKMLNCILFLTFLIKLYKSIRNDAKLNLIPEQTSPNQLMNIINKQNKTEQIKFISDVYKDNKLSKASNFFKF